MTPVNIEAIARGLFAGIPCFLEYSTGRISTHHRIPEKMQTNTDLYMKLPSFSLAHAEQIYVQENYGDTDAYKAYGLDEYPIFPVTLLTDELRKQASQFREKVHVFIMDRLDDSVFEAYHDFTDDFCIDFAKKWCKENGIPYQYMYKDNL